MARQCRLAVDHDRRAHGEHHRVGRGAAQRGEVVAIDLAEVDIELDARLAIDLPRRVLHLVAQRAPAPVTPEAPGVLLEEVLEDPTLNTREYLEKRTRELWELTDDEVKKLGQAGKEKKDEEEFREIKKLHRKHKVD